jgi:hypothetical protein
MARSERSQNVPETQTNGVCGTGIASRQIKLAVTNGDEADIGETVS